jgi:hypothetical protein
MRERWLWVAYFVFAGLVLNSLLAVGLGCCIHWATRIPYPIVPEPAGPGTVRQMTLDDYLEIDQAPRSLIDA